MAASGPADPEGVRAARSVLGRCYCPAPMARPVGSTSSRKFKRRQPSEAEQLRRTTLIRQVAAKVVASTNPGKREQGVS